MKKITAIAFSLLIVAGSATLSHAHQSVHKRQVRQQKRIHRGLRSGQLTPGEAFRLEREQVRIQRTKRAFKSDGEFTRRERARLKRMQNRSSRHIYRYKHNDRTWQ